MSNKSTGEALADVRRGLGWSQAKLAQTLGVSTVLISKIESGARPASEAFLTALESHLPDKAKAVEEAASVARPEDGRSARSLKIVEAMKLAKRNGERASRLKGRAEHAKEEADAIAQVLDDQAKAFDREVLSPFSQLLSSIALLPEDVIVSDNYQHSRANPEFAETLREAQLKTSKSIFSLLGAGVLGSGAGAAVGAGAATATYMTVASLATASTGAAISGLSGAAATSATLAAIGGGSLAAGGLGVAGGTALLTGIIALPVVAVAAGTVLASGGRILETQKSVALKIERAELDFETNEAVIRRFVTRAAQINEILTVAMLAVRNHRRVIDKAANGRGRITWDEFDAHTQASIRRVAELVLACLTVLALPIGMNLSRGAPQDALLTEVVDAESVPQIAPELDRRAELENEFVDYAIEEAFSQVAR